MNQSEIIKYINNPNLLVNCDLDQLKNLINNFPFFQTAHILYLKALLIQDKQQFKKQLSISSIYISDRDLLFKLLNREVVVGEEPMEVEGKVEPDIEKDQFLLKNRKVKRKINNSFEGMGENISETISSQIEFSTVKEKDKLEYPSEIYFIEEERDGRNNIITIDADPEIIKKLNEQKDILQLDEEELEKQRKEIKSNNESKEEPFELMQLDDINKKEKKNTEGYFDISEYESEEAIKDDLISKFIKENPRIETKEVEEEIDDISIESVKEDSNLLSETLIKVYIKQGLFEKAIESYQKLSLKYPEKNTYFASQIKILEEKLNK